MCVYVYMYMYVYVSVYVYVCVCMWIYACTCVCVCVCIMGQELIEGPSQKKVRRKGLREVLGPLRQALKGILDSKSMGREAHQRSNKRETGLARQCRWPPCAQGLRLSWGRDRREDASQHAC